MTRHLTTSQLLERKRPSFDTIWLQLAHLIAQRSTCKRAKVGAVLVHPSKEQVIAVGYNGNYRGGPNTCDHDGEGVCGCVHAETNAIVSATRHAEGMIVYATHSPCIPCAKLLVNGGISEYYYSEEYRIFEEPSNILRQGGVKLCQLKLT